jgi:hypothetical protein
MARLSRRMASNLGSRAAGMTRGTWQVVVTLANGSTHAVFTSLK